jgi:hypothetical protein
MWRDVAEPVGGLVDETLIVRRVEDRRSGRFGAILGAVSQTLGCGTQCHRPRNVGDILEALSPGRSRASRDAGDDRPYL